MRPLDLKFCSTLLLLSIILTATSLSAASLEFEECEITDHTGKRSMKAECSNLTVPENYAEPNGKTIDLFVVKVKSMSKSPEPDAFTMLAGGPGQSATESFIGSRGAFEKIRKTRDIYLIDQRGTGHSNQMQCKPDGAEYIDQFVYDSELVLEQMQRCLDTLPGDPRYYTTSVAVKDLDAVREALGMESWNLLGISYGTRVGQHYLRRYPERVRTLVLDAVAPPQLNLGPDIPFQSQRAVNQMTQRCAEDQECNNLFPELDEKIITLVSDLREQPRTVSFEDFSSGTIEEIEFSDMHLAFTMRMLLYQAHGVSILPTMLHSAYADNNFAPLARRALSVSEDMGNAMSMGMHNSVICTEDMPFLDLASVDRDALKATYMGEIVLDGLRDSCKLWPVGVIDDDFKEMVVAEQPVLVLSGTIDPITPPAYAEMIMPGLKNSLHIVNPEQGHMQTGIGCMPTVIAKFVEQGSVDGLDFSCMKRQTPEPFFVNANGPSP